MVQSRERWRIACGEGNREGEWEVLDSEGVCGTAAHANDPGRTRRLTRSSVYWSRLSLYLGNGWCAPAFLESLPVGGPICQMRCTYEKV